MISAVGFALVFASAQGHVIDSTDIRDRSSGMAMFIGAILVAGLCGPPIGGILADRIGIPGTFLVAGLLSACSFGLAYLCMPRTTARSTQGPAIRWRDFGPILSSPPLAALFFLCAMPAKIILVEEVPEGEKWDAVRDRLRRSASAENIVTYDQDIAAWVADFGEEGGPPG